MKVKVSNDQEMAQSERNFHLKPRWVINEWVQVGDDQFHEAFDDMPYP